MSSPLLGVTFRAFVCLGLASACGSPAPPPVAPTPAASSAAPPPAPPIVGAADWLRRGVSLMKLGAGGSRDAYEQAKEVLAECVVRDPNEGECYLLWGEACELTDDEQCAAQKYTQAVLHAPADAHHYLPLASTYLRFKLYVPAEQVLREGIRHVPAELTNAAGILRLYRMLAVVAEARGDRSAMVKALEDGAREGGSDPELDFELGTSYATLVPPRSADAVRALNRFAKRVCRTAAASAFKQQCELTVMLLQRIGNQAEAGTEPPPEAVPVRVVVTEPVVLPPVPELPKLPLKDGDAFTVWGASYSLRSRTHRFEVERVGSDGLIEITGYITRTNLAEAPRCAVHSPGRADPEGCVAPVPTFWLGDSRDARPEDCIRVLGWASNFAQIHDAIRAFDRPKPAEYEDVYWGTKLPNPLPSAGARVTVRGNFGRTFSRATTGIDVEPQMGILTYESVKELEPAPELATLPGMPRRRSRLAR